MYDLRMTDVKKIFIFYLFLRTFQSNQLISNYNNVFCYIP